MFAEFVIGVSFTKRWALRPGAVGEVLRRTGPATKLEGQPQFQLETGPTWVGVDVHCWVASCASIDSRALTIVFMGRFLSHRCLTPREAGHWSSAAVVAGTSVDSHGLRGWSCLQTPRWVSRRRHGETTVVLAQKWDN
jgi:hypothetical protein